MTPDPSDNFVFAFGTPVTTGEVRQVFYIFCLPFLVFWCGRDAPVPFDFKDDLFYRIYIYAWPFAQIIIHFLGVDRIEHSSGAIPLFVLSTIATLPLAWLSWKLVEKPASKLKMLFS
jgi:peptidoglycan/LPS O-acetylase OafA/YrhL